MSERVRFRRRGGRVFHLARYHPTGYGIHALCGYSLGEGVYTTLPNERRQTRECKRCRGSKEAVTV